MYEYSSLNQRLEFYVKASPKTFLFIKVSTIKMYRYVVARLQEFTDLAIIKLSEELDILKEIRCVHNNSVLLEIDPMQQVLLKRLDYLRDPLHNMDRLLIFILYTGQYDKLICEYPDFCAYSSPLFDYSTKLPVPFTLIFSNNLVSNDKKKIFASNIVWRAKDKGDLEAYVLNGMDKLRHTKMNEIEIQRLDKAIFKLWSESERKDLEKIVHIVLQYIDLLSSKELFDIMEEALIKSYNDLYRYMGISFSIDIIYALCITLFKAEDLNMFERNLLSETAKVLIPYYSYSNKKDDLNKALQLSTVRVNYIREYVSSDTSVLWDNMLAESYNDKIILDFMTKQQNEQCLSNIDFLGCLQLNYENVFLYFYNKAILLLLTEKYKDALDVCDEFIEKHGQFMETGMAYHRIRLIKIWIQGMYDRHLQEAIDSNIEILRNHRSVFSENHYSIAEIHFCNANMYYELNEIEKSRHCIVKAQNILKQNHSARLKRLKGLVDDFAVRLRYEESELNEKTL